MHFSTKFLGLLGLSAMFTLGLSKPMPQGGYAVPSAPTGEDCAGSDGETHSDVLACPAHPEAVDGICQGTDWDGDNCGGGALGPNCVNGNFCTGTMHGEAKNGQDMISYYNDMGCNCDG
jgi:hypothetical protein